jgi:hypothetical protein
MRDNHPELRRHDVEPLRRLLADHMHRRAAVGAVRVFRLDGHINMRQMGGERTAIGATLVGTLLCRHRILLVLDGLVGGNGLLDVLESQKQLIAIELLRASAELRTLQLTQKMPQSIVLQQRLVALCNRSITLGARRRLGGKAGRSPGRADDQVRFRTGRSASLSARVASLETNYKIISDRHRDAVTRAERAEADLTESLEVIEPFAQAAKGISSNWNDELQILHSGVTVGELRRARAFLERTALPFPPQLETK